jgi:hypothetical protein
MEIQLLQLFLKVIILKRSFYKASEVVEEIKSGNIYCCEGDISTDLLSPGK